MNLAHILVSYLILRQLQYNKEGITSMRVWNAPLWEVNHGIMKYFPTWQGQKK
jgi:hypothetical protein